MVKKNKIIFINTLGADEVYAPTPAAFEIPQWYKDTPSYKNNEKKPDQTNNIPSTVKKCMPVFDAMTSGYIIKSYTDVYISQKYGHPWFEWPSMGPISFHPIEQAEKHPKQNGIPYPKWVNAWSIKTPKGYSCLFIPPMHRDNVFEILPGIVDTDKLLAAVSFPFTLKSNSWEGLIPAGTPIAQVIPFERKSWKMEIGGEDLIMAEERSAKLLRTRFFDSYKTFFWQRKDYR
jgi:hypothetical protein